MEMFLCSCQLLLGLGDVVFCVRVIYKQVVSCVFFLVFVF